MRNFRAFADGLCDLWRLPRLWIESDREVPFFLKTHKLPTSIEDIPPLLPDLMVEQWGSQAGRLWVQTDNQQLEQLMGGRAKLQDESERPLFVRIARVLWDLMNEGWAPRQDVSDFIEWDLRDKNSVADHCANVALDARREWAVWDDEVLASIQTEAVNIRLCVDGALRGTGEAAAGIAIYAYPHTGDRILLHRAGRLLGKLSSAFLAEAMALELGLEAFRKLLIKLAPCSGK